MLSRVHALDLRIDAWVERIRSPAARPGVLRPVERRRPRAPLAARRVEPRRPRAAIPRIALRMGAALGVESLLTNGPIKAMFRRVRPEDDHPPEGPLPYGMHRPVTSSFPSGHAASAFTAATLLAGGPATPVWFALAAAVASSRVVHAHAPHLRHRRRRRARRRARRDRRGGSSRSLADARPPSSSDPPGRVWSLKPQRSAPADRHPPGRSPVARSIAVTFDYRCPSPTTATPR